MKRRRILLIAGAILAILIATTALAAVLPPVHGAITRVLPPLGAALPGNDERYIVNGPSMEPTLHSGQSVGVRYYGGALPQRGDIVIFHAPNSPYLTNIKRIIGIPHDTIQVTADAILVNGAPLTVPPSQGANENPAGLGTITLSSGQYYVVGDNLRDSADSREFGPISLASIIGKAQT